MRKRFFGKEASTVKIRDELIASCQVMSITRSTFARAGGERVFQKHGRQLAAIVHTAAQPSHDGRARPQMDLP